MTEPDAQNTSATTDKQPELGGLEDETVAAVEGGVQINAAGYKDQLKRQYNLLALAGIALTVDNAWAALGSTISVSIGTQYWAYKTTARMKSKLTICAML
jgi:hypothetical protein